MTHQVTTDLAANVWKVLVTEGAIVSAGDILVILESMKMEIPVEAPSDGTVTKVAVKEGDVIDEGDLIAQID
jgi:Pyruvate carboxylase